MDGTSGATRANTTSHYCSEAEPIFELVPDLPVSTWQRMLYVSAVIVTLTDLAAPATYGAYGPVSPFQCVEAGRLTKRCSTRTERRQIRLTVPFNGL